jgi:acetolactate decarboxylase
LSEFTERMEARLPSKNYFYAIKVHGGFTSVRARSVPRQSKPYPPLAEVTPLEAIFPLREVSGTAVCLWTPAFEAGINAAGMHCHFISDDQAHGGHALDFEIGEVDVEMSTLRRHISLFPDQEEFQDLPLPPTP